jgi:sensor histidine kinase YesM
MHRKTQAIQSNRQAVRTASLRHQLSPHFLFNALNSVNWLWVQGKQRQAIDNMGAFIRLWQEHWNNGTDNHHTLAEELDSISQYLQLEAMRLGMPLEIEASWKDEVSIDHVIVPKLFLQPLAENAIWHGFAHAPANHHPAKINLVVSQRMESAEVTYGGMNVQWIDVEVLDNGVGLSQEGNADSSSVGMTVVRETLHSMDSRSTLTLESAPKPWSTSCKVSFPWTGPKAPIQATSEKERLTGRLSVPH